MTKPLSGLVVVETAGSVAGAYCGRMFATSGATVLRAGPSRLTTSQQIYLHHGKSPVQLDDVVWSDVDVLIESSTPEPVVPLPLSADHVVRVQLSHFGTTGVRSHWRGSDLVDYALGGHSYLYGDPDRAPLQGPANQPAVAAGLFGFVGAMAALLARERLGRGQTVDVSHVQVMASLHQITLLRWLMNTSVLTRMGNRYTGQGQPNGPYPCVDGWVSIACVTSQQIDGLLAVTGLSHLLDDPDIDSPLAFQLHPERIDVPLRRWLADQTVDEVVELLQALRIPAAPLRAPADLVTDPQLVDRGFFEPVPTQPSVVQPGRPFRFSHHQPPGPHKWQPGPVDQGPLAGLRVLDLSRVWAGPMCARILADLGADVVCVEAPWQRGPQTFPQSAIDAALTFPNNDGGDQPWNRNAHHVNFALSKRGLALDLQSEAGHQVFTRLVPHAHVLIENFSPRVMPQLNLDEDQLHRLNPDLIYTTMPGYGRSGPAVNWLAYGSTVDSHAGLSHLVGYPDAHPWKGGVSWPDPIAGLHATSAILTALWAGQHHGSGGVTIEAAQFESTVAAIGEQVVAAQLGDLPPPAGNRSTRVAAQGVYRCAGGDDRWIAISAFDHADVIALFNELELDPALVSDAAAFDHAAFDGAVAEAASTRDASDLAEQLQQAGIAAGHVTTAPELLADPHLLSRDTWVHLDQPQLGRFTSPTTPISLSATPVAAPRPAPLLGQHNAQVMSEADFSADEIAALTADRVLTDYPPA